jgi:outer membrane protein W
MKRILLAVALCLFLSTLGFSAGLSFKATGGLSLLMGGNWNDVVEGQNAFYQDVLTSVSTPLDKLSMGLTFEGEIIYHVTENVGIGVGSGYITASKDSTLDGDLLGFPFSLNLKPSVTAIPVMLNLHYFLPISPSMNVHFYVGPGIYFSTVKLDDNLVFPGLAINALETFRPESKTAFGVQGGIGLELAVSTNVFLVLDAQGRFVDISDLVGDLTESGTVLGIPINATYTNQKYWYYESLSGGTYYGTFAFNDTQPSGTGIRNVKDGAFSLTGVTFQAGFRVGF